MFIEFYRNIFCVTDVLRWRHNWVRKLETHNGIRISNMTLSMTLKFIPSSRPGFSRRPQTRADDAGPGPLGRDRGAGGGLRVQSVWGVRRHRPPRQAQAQGTGYCRGGRQDILPSRVKICLDELWWPFSGPWSWPQHRDGGRESPRGQVAGEAGQPLRPDHRGVRGRGDGALQEWHE